MGASKIPTRPSPPPEPRKGARENLEGAQERYNICRPHAASLPPYGNEDDTPAHGSTSWSSQYRRIDWRIGSVDGTLWPMRTNLLVSGSDVDTNVEGSVRHNVVCLRGHNGLAMWDTIVQWRKEQGRHMVQHIVTCR